MEKIFSLIAIVVVTLCICFCSGCTTTTGIITDESIIASQISAERIQAANTVVREQIRLATAEIDDIRETAQLIASGVNRAYYLFEQYESLVHRIISGLGKVEHATRIREGEGSGPEPGITDSGASFYN